ncbi:nucleotidyltransferase domain-containing protein [Candidatus Poribacteria bacterium]|nr:MAG: nucleotidyltransferase domain-containing protein [Candidatus Poribacteria bacterium]
MRRRSSSSVRIFYPPYTLDELLDLLRRGMPELRRKLPVKRVVLFGSYAKGRHTPASDVDLLVIYSGERREDAYKLVRKTLKIRGLEPHVYSEEEYEAVRSTVERMIDGGITIYGG